MIDTDRRVKYRKDGHGRLKKLSLGEAKAHSALFLKVFILMFCVFCSHPPDFIVPYLVHPPALSLTFNGMTGLKPTSISSVEREFASERATSRDYLRNPSFGGGGSFEPFIFEDVLLLTGVLMMLHG